MNNIKTNRILLAVLILAAVIGVVWWAYNNKPPVQSEPQTVLEQAAQSGDTRMSLNGIVTKIEGNQVYFNTGRVENTPQGNQFIKQEVILIVTDKTVFNKDTLTTRAVFADLKIGSIIIAEVNENPFERERTEATRIMIQK